MSKETRDKHDIKRRYAWHWKIIVFILFLVWGYGIYGTAFVQIPKFQWVLALINPLVRDFYTMLFLKVVQKAAGKEFRGKKSLKFLVAHYVSTKHVVFLAIIVGGVATPASSICIMMTNFAGMLQSSRKIIKKHGKGQNTQGKKF